MTEEIKELQEHAEEGAHDPKMKPVTITMAILAVLIAVVSLMGHREHTEELLTQDEITDQWAHYQAKSIRKHADLLFLDQITLFNPPESSLTEKAKEKYSQEAERYGKQQSEIEEKTRTLEHEIVLHRRRANRFDLGEVLLESAIVITSITLLTRQTLFWVLGLLFGTLGLLVAISGFFIR